MGVIRRQGIKNAITSYVGIIIGFINLIIIQPRFLTPDELGLTRVLYSFSLIFAVFVPMGIGSTITKYFPKFKNEKTAHRGFLNFTILFPLAGYLIAAIFILVFKEFIISQWRRESPIFLDYFNYVFPLIFFVSFIMVLSNYCNANYKSTIPAFLNDVVTRLLTIVLVTVYFNKWLTLEQFIACYVGIFGVQMLFIIIYIFYFDKLTFKIDWKYFREQKVFELIRYGMLLWFASVASIGLKYFDSLMVGKYMPIGNVAVYTIAAFIPTIIEAPLNAIDKIAASRISFAWAENNRKEINDIYHKSSLYMILLGGFLFLNVNINIKNLLTFLPEVYHNGSKVVLIISIGTLFNMATGLNGAILFNSDKYRYGAYSLIVLAVVVVALNMIFIPMFGIEGAALATSGSSLIFNALLFVAVWKFYQLQPFDKRNLKVLLLIVISFGANFIIPSMQNVYADIVFRSFIISSIYLGGIYVMKVVPEFHKYLPWEK